ncbi:unnamed protein product [Ranitomeya imitator]|uniref:ABC transporter domain-containing protein n=1 Tax=Ranitomeya imitator TaxID=111125 RepID=A0ABN9LFJ5_9NEOB|nr:unnamed protein product [Ranitomeya imitator]
MEIILRSSTTVVFCGRPAECEKLLELYERLEELDAAKAEVRASRILHGLGFTPAMQRKKLKDFSGGWRMRVALASFRRILVLVSHSQDFLNGVCTNIIHLHNRKLKYYTGNYDQYVKTRLELEENQMKRFNWEQDQIAHMKNYIARFGHGSAKLARQAQSKEKTLQKMMSSGLTERVVTDKVSLIYKNLEFGIDLDTRVALVGPNGAGKSTLLKLLTGEICCNLSTTESTPGQSEDSTCPEEKRGLNPELQKNGETKVAELARLLRANSANGKKDTQSSWSAETKHLRYVSKV